MNNLTFLGITFILIGVAFSLGYFATHLSRFERWGFAAVGLICNVHGVYLLVQGILHEIGG
ncbi:hypothetical protein AXY46_03195 [Achromobacter xylosoxidans]|nr:hypothetical protein AXY46_03195 [Achromobacter xylosoxidans]